MEFLIRLKNAYKDDLKVSDIQIGGEQVRDEAGNSIVYGKNTGQKYVRPVSVCGGRRVEQLTLEETIVALTPLPLKGLIIRVKANSTETRIVKK